MSSISSVSRNTAVSSNKPTISPREKEIQSLMKQRSRINEELQGVKTNNELDSKIKMERIKTLSASIQQIDAQISQIRSEELQEKAKSVTNEQPQKSKEPVDKDVALMDGITKKSVLYDQLGKLKGVRDRLENSAQKLVTEVDNDRKNLEFSPAAGEDDGVAAMLENAENTTFQMKRDMVADLEQQVRVTDDQMAKLISASQPAKTSGVPIAEEEDAVDNSDSKVGQEEHAGSPVDTPAASANAGNAIKPSASPAPSAELGTVVDIHV